jgi:adenosylmethionine-8-amino-7-oxononanoate aminotransferase
VRPPQRGSSAEAGPEALPSPGGGSRIAVSSARRGIGHARTISGGWRNDVEPYDALVLERGEGSYLFDSDGKRYFDAVGGLWCTNIGLGREEMAEAIAEQVRKMAYASAFVDLTNAPAVELAAKLARLAPGALNHVFLTTGGSTAVDTAFRLIQYYQNCRGKHDKKHVISRNTIHHVSCPNSYRAPDGMSEAEYLELLVRELEGKILELGPHRVAAFFAEPVMGAGGVIVPPADYNRRTREICRSYDVLYVADEVVTAFGRLGHWFASQEVFGIEPDIVTCAKGLSSGYLPLGATIYSDEIHETISAGNPDRVFAHGFTYSGHPVCCAAALKNIEIMEREDILANAREVGSYFEARLQTLRELPIVGDVRGMKLMMCIENVAEKETKRTFPDAMNIGKRIANKCDELGLIVRPIIHLNVMSPPLVMTRDEVDFTVETLGTGIRAVVDDLVRSGELAPSSG